MTRRPRLLAPLTGDVQLTLDGLAVEPHTDGDLASAALPLARQLALAARGPLNGRVARRLVALLESHQPVEPRRVA